MGCHPTIDTVTGGPGSFEKRLFRFRGGSSGK